MGTERKKMLEDLLRLESTTGTNNNTVDGSNSENMKDNIDEDEQLNELMAVTEEEFQLYMEIDKERKRTENLSSPRLLSTESRHHIPQWLLQEIPTEKSTTSSSTEMNLMSSVPKRKRKEISYDEQYTDTQFVQMIENGEVNTNPPSAPRASVSLPQTTSTKKKKEN